jgi:hypothetical protein
MGPPRSALKLFLDFLSPGLIKLGMGHISDDDWERYHRGKVIDEAELAALEEHIRKCPACAERAEVTLHFEPMPLARI